ncbi:MAG: acetate--CoA ligase family protein [Candidatus Marsarchaeota archaeon]|nr:acetate--CoA ligase family protein [Candidatus Marsarchaeota archaeon]
MQLMDYIAARGLLKKYGIKSIDSSYVRSADEAVTFSKGKPIVLKALSDKALHKSRNKLVELNLSKDSEIRQSFNALSKRAAKFKPYKILAQHMSAPGIEIIIGSKVDPQFGPMVMIGLGGIYVETFKDVALRVCPITKYDAQSMINQLKSKRVIAPDPKSVKLLEELLVKVSRMVTQNKISELDLNPIILHSSTYDAVDLRILK